MTSSLSVLIESKNGALVSPRTVFVMTSKAIYLLLGGLGIGYLAGEAGMAKYAPFFFNLFYGVFALFLIDKGVTVSRKMQNLKQNCQWAAHLV